MKLYHAATSPYVRKVMMVLHHTGQTDAVELVEGAGTPVAPNAATASANPLSKVPCLITDDGQTLVDSRVICRYLDWKGQGGLYPDGAALFPVLAVEALSDGILDAAILAVYENRLRPEEIRFQPWIEAQLGKCLNTVQVLEGMVPSGPVTAAHIAVGAALGYLDFRHPGRDWRSKAPKLADWYAEFSQAEAMRATAPPA